jgi:signal transduction histidine kinase
LRNERPRRGIQLELLVGLAIVMATATAALLFLGLRIQESRLAQAWPLAADALARITWLQAELPLGPAGAEWWRLDAKGIARPLGDAPPIDADTRAFAEKAAMRGEWVLAQGWPWNPVLFARPDASGVAVMRLPAVVPPALLTGIVLGSIAIFTAFGATVLRGGVVLPLERLSSAARAVAAGDLAVRVREEGVTETAGMARAFNEMTEALAGRTQALEKAVADLRESSRNLRTARQGLERAERLAAVGRLAAGVAHEVGNPAAALLAFLDLVARDPSLSDASRAHLAKARTQVERVRSILRDLLGFARPTRGECAPVDLEQVVEEVLGLVRAQRRYAGVDFRLIIEGDVPPALADRAAVAQLLLNLVVNAGDAVRPAGGGVRVCLAPAALERRAGDPAGSAPDGLRSPAARSAQLAGRFRIDAVELRVEDDGPGVPVADRERIFDPFFTTKDPGEGTGLGLANALRCAEQMDGRLDLAEPEPGAGAIFVVTLPAAPASGSRGSGADPIRARCRPNC